MKEETTDKQLAKQCNFGSCPVCNKQYSWKQYYEPTKDLVVFGFYCKECGTTDSLAIPKSEYIEMVTEH